MRTVIVTNPQGLHARPADLFVKLASQFESKIEVIKDGERVDGKSILDILTLAAVAGHAAGDRGHGPRRRSGPRGAGGVGRTAISPRTKRSDRTSRAAQSLVTCTLRSRRATSRSRLRESTDDSRAQTVGRPAGRRGRSVAAVARSELPRRRMRPRAPKESHAETTRNCRFAGRGHRRSAGDGQRGISHPSPVRRARRRRARAGAARPGHRRRRRRDRAQSRRRRRASWASSTRAIFAAHLQMLRDPRLRERAGSDDPRAALLARVRRQPRAAPLRQGLSDRSTTATWPSGPTTSSTSKSGCCATCSASAAKSCRSSTSPVIVLAHNLTPSETANLDREFVRGFVTEVGGPGSHTAIVAEGMEIPAVVGTGPFLTDVSGGDTGDHRRRPGLVILQPDEETIARYRARGRSSSARWPRGWRRCATCRPRPPTACASSCWATSSFPHEVEHCLERGSDGIGLYRTEFLYLGADSRADRRRPFRGLRRASCRRWQASRSSSARSTWGPTRCRSCPSPKTSATRSWACAAFACRCATCRCSARSCGRSCGPACWATCGSCSR